MNDGMHQSGVKKQRSISDEIGGEEQSFSPFFAQLNRDIGVAAPAAAAYFGGTAGADVILGTSGADQMEGLAGDDTYYVNAAGDTVIELANGGRDTVHTSVNYTMAENVEEAVLTTAGLSVKGNVLNNTFQVEVAGGNVIDGAGGVNVANYFRSATGVAVGFAPANGQPGVSQGGDVLHNFRTVIGSKYDDVIIGNEAANMLVGGFGNDILRGGAGDDILVGANGNETYIFARGDGVDRIMEADQDGSSNDVVSFLAGVSVDQLWFKRVGDGLEVSVIGTADSITLPAWYTNAAARIEKFRTADGRTLLGRDVQTMVNAMANLAPPALGQLSLPAAYATALAPTFAANWRVNAAPSGAVTIVGTARQGQILTAVNTLADTNGVGIVKYNWYADGLAVAATGDRLALTFDQVGKKITVTASYIDGAGAPEAVSSVPSAAVARNTAAAMNVSNSSAEQLVQAMAAFAPPSAAHTGWPVAAGPAAPVLLAVPH